MFYFLSVTILQTLTRFFKCFKFRVYVILLKAQTCPTARLGLFFCPFFSVGDRQTQKSRNPGL
jgi:hypothetical protein